MKQLFLVAAFLISTCLVAFAGEGPTKASNEAAMKTGRTALTAKIAELEQNLNTNNTQAAQVAAKDVLRLMQKGIAQTRVQLDLAKRDEQKAINARFLELEGATHKYKTLSTDLGVNGKQMLEQARNFMKQY